jgi:type II secretory pathway pseudopilin PulG
VELLIALTVFAIVITAVAAGMYSALNLSKKNRQRSTAAFVATSAIEQVRGLNAATIPIGQTVTTSTVNGVAYTVTRTAAWTSPTSTSDNHCSVASSSSAGSVFAYVRVRVQITWSDMGGVQPVTSETLLTPPPGALDRTKGHIGVTVVDRDGAALAGHTVSLSHSAVVETAATNADGCAFFDYLTPGSYTVSVGTPGYTDRQGNQPAATTLSVTANTLSTARFDYDRAATITVATTTTPSTAGVPDAMQVTVANSNLTVGTTRLAWTRTATSVGPLFPYTSGYQLWAGGCADADPQYTGYTGSRGVAVTTNPGGSSSATVTLVAQTVLVRRNTTPNPVQSGVRLRAVHIGSAGCPAGNETLTFSTVSTDGSGLVTLLLPYGQWQIEATNRVTTSIRPTVSIRPGLPTSQVEARVSNP